MQLLALMGKLDRIDADAVAAYVVSMQQPDGSFVGDKWGEVDTRFSYCALSCLALLGRLDAVDVPKAVSLWRQAGGAPARLASRRTSLVD